MRSLKQIFTILILLTGPLFAQTNLTFPSGTNLPNAKFVNGQIRVTATGNADLYTVPTNRRALFVGLQVYNDSPNALTSIVEAKIGGVYYSIATYWTTTAAGATTGLNPTPPIILEAGQSLSVNVNQQPVNVIPVILEFDNTANVFSKTLTSLTTGDNTIYTVPTGKSAMLMTMNLIPYAHNQVIGYWNSSGGTRTTKVNIVPNGGTPSNANLLGGAQTTANGAVSNNTLNFGLVSVTLNAGDSVSINVDNGTATQFAWITVMQIGQ